MLATYKACLSFSMLTSLLAAQSGSVPMCDYHGLSCLTKFYEEIQLERKSCDCMTSCEEPEYDIVYSSPDGWVLYVHIIYKNNCIMKSFNTCLFNRTQREWKRYGGDTGAYRPHWTADATLYSTSHQDSIGLVKWVLVKNIVWCKIYIIFLSFGGWHCWTFL